MPNLYRQAIGYFGAHLIHQRGPHEIDRANQRIVIATAVAALMVWTIFYDSASISDYARLLPYIAIGYLMSTLVYRKMLQVDPDAGVFTQYLYIVLDPFLTVYALAVMPALLSPLNMLILVQVVRCGIRFGERTMWLAWASAVLCSSVLFPLTSFWVLSEPLTRSYIAMLAVTPILFGPLIRKLHRVSADLRAAATSDPLTGLGNRRMLSEHLRLAQERCHRDRTMLALILFDLDHFKQVNDTFGHPVGDELLGKIAAAVKANSRAGDFLARIGGDEFVLLVEGLSPVDGRIQAEGIAQKIVDTVRSVAVEVAPDIPVSASVGVHCWSHTQHGVHTDADLIEVADRAMYSAKRTGKSRVVLAAA